MEQFYNFVDKHSTITHLSIINNRGPVDWSRLSRSLQLLSTIKLYNYRFSADDAIEFINNFQNLKKFCFILNGDYESFYKRLGNKWAGRYNTNFGLVEFKLG